MGRRVDWIPFVAVPSGYFVPLSAFGEEAGSRFTSETKGSTEE